MRKKRLKHNLRQTMSMGTHGGSIKEKNPTPPAGDVRRIRSASDRQHGDKSPCGSHGSLKNDLTSYRPRHGSATLDQSQLTPDGNLFEFLRDSDSHKPHGVSTGSFHKRRRSFEGRIMNKDFINHNGNLHKHDSDSGFSAHHRNNDRLAKADSKDIGTHVPSIVVESPISEPEALEPPCETDCLLDRTLANQNATSKEMPSNMLSNATVSALPLNGMDNLCESEEEVMDAMC